MKVWICRNEEMNGKIWISKDEPFWQIIKGGDFDGSEYWDWEDKYDNRFLIVMDCEEFKKEFGFSPPYKMKFLADLTIKDSENPIRYVRERKMEKNYNSPDYDNSVDAIDEMCKEVREGDEELIIKLLGFMPKTKEK